MKDDVTSFTTNQKHDFNNKNELKKIIEVPLKAASEGKSMLIASKQLKKYIKGTVKADFEVARLNLKTCIKGSIKIITSNYQFFKANDEFIIRTKKKLKISKIIYNDNLYYK
jgi:hypothetical protein